MRWLAAAALLAAAVAPAQGRPRVVVLKSADLSAYSQVAAGFSAEARAVVEQVQLEDNEGAVARTLAALKKDPPKLVLAIGPAAAVGARRSFSDVPVVFAMVPYFQRYELEGLNTTGVSLTSDLSLELAALKALSPGVKRVGVVNDPKYSADLLAAATRLGEPQGLSIVSLDVDGPGRLEKVLQGARGKIDALIIVSDKTVGTAKIVQRLIAWANQQKLPSVGLAPAQVRLGALFALSPSPVGVGQQVGRIANRILHEKVDPGAMAVANPEGVELHVNLETAAGLGDAKQFAFDLVTFARERGVAVKVAQPLER